MDAFYFVLLWLAIKIRNTLIIGIVITLAAEMTNKLTETTQEILSNPKTTGAIAAGGTGTAFYDRFVSAAPDILIILSILATMLTIWAHLSARKRHKREDQLREQRAQEESEMRQLEIGRLRREIEQKDVSVKELEIRAQAAELFYEHLKKNDPKALERINCEVVDFMSRRNG